MIIVVVMVFVMIVMVFVMVVIITMVVIILREFDYHDCTPFLIPWMRVDDSLYSGYVTTLETTIDYHRLPTRCNRTVSLSLSLMPLSVPVCAGLCFHFPLLVQ